VFQNAARPEAIGHDPVIEQDVARRSVVTSAAIRSSTEAPVVDGKTRRIVRARIFIAADGGERRLAQAKPVLPSPS
jgi:hypothetical protein